MDSYAQVALNAARKRGQNGPVSAWDVAAARSFPASESRRQKSCPRSAFLGLCEEGMVMGFQKGNYTRSKLNKQYAVAAVRILRTESSLADDPKTLWRRVLGGGSKTPNHQMEVVVALWRHNLITEDKA